MINKKMQFSIDNLLENPLTEKITLYIPSKEKDGTSRTQDAEKIRDNVIHYMSEVFGGATCENVTGSYYSQENKTVVTEKVYKIYSHAPNNFETYKNTKSIIQYAKQIKLTLNQESIAIGINENLYLL